MSWNFQCATRSYVEVAKKMFFPIIYSPSNPLRPGPASFIIPTPLPYRFYREKVKRSPRPDLLIESTPVEDGMP